ncbi:MAG: tRNA (guanosine(37)-N1)-methyltransferase TrmD [Oscillospiraceae bacterium]|jgi:tRNA (guanine37-N1)-methyltransferase|nr:tRNA (guanosine(37)-N1)-methyltransferase TrmD [Oscillospiraceae bacterium]
MYRIDILTLFPETVETVLSDSVIGRARAAGHIDFRAWQIRDYTLNRQHQVDDAPYGGGNGCVMYAQPLADCKRAVEADAGRSIHTIYLSPVGKPFSQQDSLRLAREYDRLILVCGHYEGVDERFIEECVDEELSLGDFVLTGGEIPALALADSVFRLVPGVLANDECFEDESHFSGLLEYPQYTRPEIWEGRAVPEILRSGNHAAIAKWRRLQSLLRTKLRRPDMFARLKFETKQDVKLLRELDEMTAGDEE